MSLRFSTRATCDFQPALEWPMVGWYSASSRSEVTSRTLRPSFSVAQPSFQEREAPKPGPVDPPTHGASRKAEVRSRPPT